MTRPGRRAPCWSGPRRRGRRATTAPSGSRDSAWPDARIVEALGQAGLAAEFLSGGGGLKLFVLTGYVQAEDVRLDGAPGGLTGVIGAAPVF